MADNKVNPIAEREWQALVQIAKNHDHPRIKQAIEEKFLNGVSLEQAERRLLRLAASHPEITFGVDLTHGYTPESFNKLIEHFRQTRSNGRLLPDIVEEAIRNHNIEQLEHFPAITPTRQHPEEVRESKPQTTETTPAGPVAEATSATGSERTKSEGGKTEKPHQEPPRFIKEAKAPEEEEIPVELPTEDTKPSKITEKPRPAATGAESEQQIQEQPQQQQFTRTPPPRRPSSPPPSEGEPEKEKKEDKKRRWLPKPKPAQSNLWNPFARKLAQWGGRLARGLIRGLGNIARTVLPHIGRALSALGRGLMQLGGRLAGQLAGIAGRSLLTGIGGAIAGVGFGTIAIWAVIIGLTAFTLWSLYDSTSECGQPGRVIAEKYTNKDSYSEGENIDYTIRVTYEVKCPHAYADIDVRDNIPANTTYVPGTAKASALQLTGGQFLSIDTPTLVDGQLDGNTLVWRIERVRSNIPALIKFSLTADSDNVWIANQASISYRTYTSNLIGPSSQTNGRVIDTQSGSLGDTIVIAAQNVGMDPALLKAVIKVEAGAALEYSEEEFLKFSQPGWWEGLTADAGTRGANHPDILRGYAYNTCAYTRCAPGADVRGVTQFELGTWNGIVSQLQFPDGHTPDRRIARDAIFGSAILNRRNAESYAGTADVQWTEDVIRAMARMYCAGPAAGRNPSRINDPACMAGGRTYDDLVLDYYREFSGR